MQKIVILFVVLTFHGPVAGQKIQLSEEFSPRGGEVRIALSTTFDSLWGMSFSIDYDSTVLKYRSFVSHPDYSGQYDTLINDLSAENGQIGFQLGSLNESAELLKGDILGYFFF